ncbi:MAG TPA: glycosyltransferase family A protein [Phycisphaerae bacterium]|nr:glycosyltransferase family A protein [Phycisphaerae bacterium]
MSDPRVSAVIPTMNMGRFLSDAVASIMRQKIRVHEIFIIDSHSSDTTRQVVAKLKDDGAPIRFIQTDKNTPAAARNVALAQACGEIIAFLDADDLWPENKLQHQLRRMDQTPRLDMVSGFVRYFDLLDVQKLAPAADSRIETLYHVHLGACLFRKSVFEQIGLLDESFTYAEDVDLQFRIRERQIPFAIMREVTLYYRRHPDSMMSRKHPRKKQDFHRAVARSLVRRRAGGSEAADLDPLEKFVDPEVLA